MPNWKKLIVSGSDANLNSITVQGTGSFGGTVGIGTTSPSHLLSVEGPVSASTYYGDGSNLTGITADGYGNSIKLSQTVAATTWSLAHNIGDQFPVVQVFDTNDNQIIPGRVEMVDDNNLKIYFDTATAGTAAVNVGGIAFTASYAENFRIESALVDYQENIDVDSAAVETVATVNTGSYSGAFFDYTCISGSNARAGTVMAIYNGGSVEYTDNSTSDIGDTSGVTFSVDTLGANMRLRATVTSNDWSIKTLVRAL